MLSNIMGKDGLNRDSARSTIQEDTTAHIYVAEGDLGKGLFAGERIKKGALIYRFHGPVIGFQEAVNKGEMQCYPLQISKGKYIDIESPGCFSNHSCEPNAGIRNDIELFAIADIEPGKEIRYDYSTTMDEDFFTMSCRCGTPSCRRVVTDFKLLPLALQKKYLAMGIVMQFIFEQNRQSNLVK